MRKYVVMEYVIITGGEFLRNAAGSGKGGAFLRNVTVLSGRKPAQRLFAEKRLTVHFRCAVIRRIVRSPPVTANRKSAPLDRFANRPSSIATVTVRHLPVLPHVID